VGFTDPKDGTLRWKDFGEKGQGGFTYTPNATNWPGYDSFTYVISNGQGYSRATVTIGTENGYADFVTQGNPNGANVYAKQGGYLLQGGGKEVDSAFVWLIQHAGGRNIVVLRDSQVPNAAEDMGYNTYLRDLAIRYNLKLGNIETIDFYGTTKQAKAAAQLAVIGAKLRNAGAIFIAGGDQGRYITIWQNRDKPTQVEQALNAVIKKGNTTIGGTSAGLAILGDVVYYDPPPPNDKGTTSPQALTNPFNGQMLFTRKFVNIPFLQNTITDTHFGLANYGFPGVPELNNYDRLGRMMAFLARMMQPGRVESLGQGAVAHGLGVDANTALELDVNGVGKVLGSGFAYFFAAPNKPNVLKEAKPPVPLTYATIKKANGVTTFSSSVQVYRIWGGNCGNSVDLDPQQWALVGGNPLYVWVNAGILYVGGQPHSWQS
jgi:cyanophycinase-like exopeptidase